MAGDTCRDSNGDRAPQGGECLGCCPQVWGDPGAALQHEGPHCRGNVSHAAALQLPGLGELREPGWGVWFWLWGGVVWLWFWCHPRAETAGTQTGGKMHQQPGGCWRQVRMGTAVQHCDPAGTAPGDPCPARPPRLCPGMGPTACIPVTRHLLQSHLRARTFTVRAEELPRDSRKPDTPRCSPCGPWYSRGMSRPRLLSLLLLLLCCQVRTGRMGLCSAPAPMATPGRGTAWRGTVRHCVAHQPLLAHGHSRARPAALPGVVALWTGQVTLWVLPGPLRSDHGFPL